MEGTGDDDGWEMVHRTGKTRVRSVGAIIGQREHVKSPGVHATNCCYSTKSKIPSAALPACHVENAVTSAECKSPQSVIQDSGINGTAVVKNGTINNGEQSLETCWSVEETIVSHTDSQNSTNTVTDDKQPLSDDILVDHCQEQQQQQGEHNRNAFSDCEPTETDIIGALAGAAPGFHS